MEYRIKLEKEIEKFNDFYNKVCERAKNTNNLVDQAYRHEARTVIGRLQNAEDLMTLGKEGEEVAKEILQICYKNEIPQLRNLENLVKIGDLTKTQILSESSNFYEIMKRQENIHKDYMDSKNISYNTFGTDEITAFNPAVASTLISTLYGNAVKWAPNDTKINQKVKIKNNHAIIKIENEFGESPNNPEIGENKGIGTLFTNTILQRIKGSIEYYNKAKLENTENPIYGIKVVLPLE